MTTCLPDLLSVTHQFGAATRMLARAGTCCARDTNTDTNTDAAADAAADAGEATARTAVEGEHFGDCPMSCLVEVFASFGVVGPQVQDAVDCALASSAGTTGDVKAEVRRRTALLSEPDQARAVVAYGLCLIGAAYTRVRVDAALSRRTWDLDTPAVARFAVMDYLTRSSDVPLGAESVARLLTSPAPSRELRRATHLLADGVREDLHHTGALAGRLPDLLAELVVAVNDATLALAGQTGDPADPARSHGAGGTDPARRRVTLSLVDMAGDALELLAA